MTGRGLAPKWPSIINFVEMRDGGQINSRCRAMLCNVVDGKQEVNIESKDGACPQIIITIIVIIIISTIMCLICLYPPPIAYFGI